MKLLVPVDQSHLSQEILPAVARPSEMMPGLEIHLVTVLNPARARGRRQTSITEPIHFYPAAIDYSVRIEPRTVETRGEVIDRMEAQARDQMQRLAASNFPAASVVYHVVWHRRCAEGIVQAVDQVMPDAIAMVTRGRRGHAPLRNGSVTEDVVRRASRPILVMGPGHRAHGAI